MLASIAEAPPACLVALADADADAVPDGLPVVVLAAAVFELAPAPELVVGTDDAVMVTPSAAQIWTEIDSNAVLICC